jgi:hypothetical protein
VRAGEARSIHRPAAAGQAKGRAAITLCKVKLAPEPKEANRHPVPICALFDFVP